MIRFQHPVLDYEVPYTGLWYVEPKLVGVRLGAQRSEHGWRWFTHRGTVTPPPHVARALGWAPVGTFVDGEFVHGRDEKSAWSILGRREPPEEGIWAVFDAVAEFPCKMALSARKKLLAALVKGPPEAIREVEAAVIDSDADAVREVMTNLKEVDRKTGMIEGVVAKLASSIYRPGATNRTWRKFKWKRA
ncbi:MAG: hypothetical protein JW940_04470 [Polyangiaceae bacterium]|nr:hypothetical protein [Polyangiaceae bacterium]